MLIVDDFPRWAGPLAVAVFAFGVAAGLFLVAPTVARSAKLYWFLLWLSFVLALAAFFIWLGSV